MKRELIYDILKIIGRFMAGWSISVICIKGETIDFVFMLYLLVYVVIPWRKLP